MSSAVTSRRKTAAGRWARTSTMVVGLLVCSGVWDHRGRSPAQGGRGEKRRIIDRGVGPRVGGDEVLGGGLVVVTDVDAQHRATQGFEGFLDVLEVVDFRATRCAPLAPGVEDDDLVFEVGEVDRLALFHQRGPGKVRQRGTLVLLIEDLGFPTR